MTDARPVKIRLRKYSQVQKQFMREFVNTLVIKGPSYPKPTFKWARTPLLVPEPNARFRFTVDLRLVKSYTAWHHFPMPSLDHKLSGLKDAILLAKFDMSHGYWQLLLALLLLNSQPFFSPDGIITPTRVTHGTTSALSRLQSSLKGIIFGDLLANILI